MERMMKVQEVILNARAGRLKWWESGDHRVTHRTMRWWRAGYKEYGYDDLYDYRNSGW